MYIPSSRNYIYNFLMISIFLETILPLCDELYIIADSIIHVVLPKAINRLLKKIFTTARFIRYSQSWTLTCFVYYHIKSVFVASGLSDHHSVIIDVWFKFVLQTSKHCMPVNVS